MLAEHKPPNPYLYAADILDPPENEGVAAWRDQARNKQLPPRGEWFTWLVMAGRGFGKTRTGSEWVNERAISHDRGEEILIAGRTPSDVRDYSLHGEGGLLTHHPEIKYEPSKRMLTWPNGVVGLIRSGANPDEFRGFSGETAWLDEFAAWDYPKDCWNNLKFGLRERDPRVCITTTPRPIQTLKEIIKAKGTVLVTGSSYENRGNLSEKWVENVLEPLMGTRLGRQEIEAELLEDVEGALWKLAQIEALRVKIGEVPRLIRIVVGVDPQAVKRAGSMTGIVVVGLGVDKHLYVLEDCSINGSPAEWGARAVAAYQKWSADRVVGEVNNGGDMVESTVRAVDENVSYKKVHASRGKTIRAEPVAARTERGEVHHVGAWAALEDEMCSWTQDPELNKSLPSPNRMDAMVWAATELTGETDPAKSFGAWGR